MTNQNPSQQLSSITNGMDIYLLDQIVKGRFDGLNSVLDAGCGAGRNLVWFMRNGYETFALDEDESSIGQIQTLARNFTSSLSPDHFQVGKVEELPWGDHSLDVVLSSAVLHFAADEKHFASMLTEMWRVLRPGGVFFARLASDIGIENLIKPLAGGCALLPDGSKRFLVNQNMLLDWSRRLNGQLLDPLKTTNVQNLRCMTTWVLLKS